MHETLEAEKNRPRWKRAIFKYFMAEWFDSEHLSNPRTLKRFVVLFRTHLNAMAINQRNPTSSLELISYFSIKVIYFLSQIYIKFYLPVIGHLENLLFTSFVSANSKFSQPFHDRTRWFFDKWSNGWSAALYFFLHWWERMRRKEKFSSFLFFLLLWPLRKAKLHITISNQWQFFHESCTLNCRIKETDRRKRRLTREGSKRWNLEHRIC